MEEGRGEEEHVNWEVLLCVCRGQHRELQEVSLVPRLLPLRTSMTHTGTAHTGGAWERG